MRKNFEDVLQGIEVEEKPLNSAYPELTNYIRSLDKKPEIKDDYLFNHIKENIDQILLPDRELRTPLHQLFSKKKFEILQNINQYLTSLLNLDPTALDNCINKTYSQFEYIHKYHYKIEKNLLTRVYVEFDYLFVDVDFFQLDEKTEKTMNYFSDELRKIADKIITNFDLE